LALLLAVVAGCGDSGVKSGDLGQAGEQPPANLEAGAQAKTIDDWAAANPNNGAMGSGEQEGK
jgi:hypothetical protein